MVYNPFSTKGFAIQIAKGQLRALQSAQRRNPGMTRDQLYCRALEKWYTPLQAAAFLAKAKTLVEAFDVHAPGIPPTDFNFRWLVRVLVIDKYEDLRHDLPTPKALQDLREGVDSIISDSL
ncbi:MAG: hypothetical protein ACRERE_07105 [Candidatus Entotheonellia bacterium]